MNSFPIQFINKLNVYFSSGLFLYYFLWTEKKILFIPCQYCHLHFSFIIQLLSLSTSELNALGTSSLEIEYLVSMLPCPVKQLSSRPSLLSLNYNCFFGWQDLTRIAVCVLISIEAKKETSWLFRLNLEDDRSILRNRFDLLINVINVSRKGVDFFILVDLEKSYEPQCSC